MPEAEASAAQPDTNPGRRLAERIHADLTRRYPHTEIRMQAVTKIPTDTQLEFVPSNSDGVPVRLVTHPNQSFVMSAGRALVWEAPVAPSEKEQAKRASDAIRTLADHGMVSVRTVKWLGRFSPTFIGAPGVDPMVDEALKSRWAIVLENYTAWK